MTRLSPAGTCRQACRRALSLVDVRAHAVHRGIATPSLGAMRPAPGRGRQVLLYLNRRGYAPTLLCTAAAGSRPAAAAMRG